MAAMNVAQRRCGQSVISLLASYQSRGQSVPVMIEQARMSNRISKITPQGGLDLAPGSHSLS
jgi:hypothetical protein